MSKHDVNKAYVSPYDTFLFGFDVKHEWSASQLKEIKKHQKIAVRRDNPDIKPETDELWESF